MRSTRIHHVLFLVGAATLTAACGQSGLIPVQSPTGSPNPAAAPPQQKTVQITLPDDPSLTFDTFTGATQTVSGTNDAKSITVNGTYVLTMNLDLSQIPPQNPSACPPRPGRIPWQSGLIAFVQQNNTGSGTLNVRYDKTTQSPPLQGSNVDSWRTTIGSDDYSVQFFRWSSSALVTNGDGSSTVLYRGGSIEVFKKQGNHILAREQCFGNYVNYNLTAK